MPGRETRSPLLAEAEIDTSSGSATRLEPRLCDLDEADYPAIIALWERSGLHIQPGGRDSAEAFARQMAQGQQRAVGLRAGSDLVAVTVLTHDGRKGWINRLAIDPAYRRHGLAARLIAEAERWFVEDQGLQVWAALIEAGNAPSRALFDRLGYGQGDVVYLSKRSAEDA
jgi:GNAT superfamily N-acetyltransferase